MAAGISLLLASIALLLVLLPRPAAAFSFAYNFTSPSSTPPPGIAFQGDAFFNKAIRLTRDERLGPITSSAGRAFYSRAVPLADPVSRRPASFAFSIAAPDPAAASGDGLAFFLSPFPSALPASSAGGLLGLFNSSARGGARAALVAVEFNAYKNEWDPSDDHVGLDLGGIVSAATADWPTSMKDGRRAHARVEYDAEARNLTVALAYGDQRPAVLLWYAVDLRDYLPDSVAVGFSAATGEAAELHQVLYWELTSTVDPKEESIVLWVVLALCALLLVLVGAGVIWFVRQWRKAGELADGDIDIDDVMGGDYDELADEFVVESGPRRFRYGELAAATRNFAEERKLGQGGFGAVYRGFLRELGLEVAIERVSKGSTQGQGVRGRRAHHQPAAPPPPRPPRRMVPRAPRRLPARVRAHAQRQRRPPPLRRQGRAPHLADAVQHRARPRVGDALPARGVCPVRRTPPSLPAHWATWRRSA